MLPRVDPDGFISGETRFFTAPRRGRPALEVRVMTSARRVATVPGGPRRFWRVETAIIVARPGRHLPSWLRGNAVTEDLRGMVSETCGPCSVVWAREMIKSQHRAVLRRARRGHEYSGPLPAA